MTTMMSTTTSRAYHHGNLRAALLAQAEQIVRERGVEELSLRELARAVGVSHGAPRRHFPDRQALLDALAEDGVERLGAQLRGAALVELMFANKHREQSGALHEAAEDAFSVMLELIEQGQADGVLERGE